MGTFFFFIQGIQKKKVYTVGDVYLALNVEHTYQLKKEKEKKVNDVSDSYNLYYILIWSLNFNYINLILNFLVSCQFSLYYYFIDGNCWHD